MKKILILLVAIALSISTLVAQDVVTCKKQEALKTQKVTLNKQYGAENVDKALKGEIAEGMPEALLLKAFNTEPAKYNVEGCKAYNVFNDDILQRRKPNMPKPNPIYFVIISDGKVVKIKPAEKSSRYKIKNGAVVY